MSELLKNLNNEQNEAVIHDSGPLLIVAGAGTGKTTVLINRLAYLILEKGIKTDEILIMTFTEKATSEMTERADKILPYGYFDLWINTFHGFCERILREHALDIGLNSDFKLLNQTEQWILIKKNLDAFKLDYYRPLGNPTKFIHELIRHFSRLKDEDIKVADYLKYAESLDDDKEMEELEIKRIKELAGAYEVYNQLLLDRGYLDFGDMIVYALKLFTERPNILKIYRDKFKYVMVDEFQDTNLAQYELIKMLAAPQNNLLVVGDDDQAIYKFRGASLSNIMQFKDDYPAAKELILTSNYRSNQEILDHSYNFIQNNNPNRLETKLKIDKKLVSKKPKDKGAKINPAVKFYNFDSEIQETAWVINKLKELYQTGAEILWSDFAILVRANDTADKYLKELRRQNIPHQFVSLKGLYYKPVILDIISYFKLLDNYHESPALYRVLNMDNFKVSYPDLIAINKMARQKVWSLYEALKNVASIPDVSSEAVVNINKLIALVEEHSPLVKTQKPSQIFLRLVYDTGLITNLDHDIDREIFSYLNQFYQKVKEFESAAPDLKVKDFMEMLDLELEAGEDGALKMDFEDSEVVKVMTVHAAKGLEFKYVFIVDLVDKRFPTINRGEKISIPDALVKEKLTNSKDIHLEEERRLFYVAATRAKDELFLTAAKDYGGAKDKKPSRFIEEMGINPEMSNQAARGLSEELKRDLDNLKNVIDEKESAAKKIYHLPERFSFSQLAAYENCPLQYKFAFILKIPAPGDKASLVFGRVLHDTLYEFMGALLENKTPSLFSGISEDKILELYEKHWQPDGYNNKEEREKYYEKGKGITQKFVTDLTAEKLPQVLFLEKDFTFKIGAYAIKGKIDRVDKLPDGTLEIIDYKTGNPKEKLEWKDKKQLILYQLFLEDFLKIKVSSLSYYYLENGAKVSFTPKEKEIIKLQEETLAEMEEIRKLNFTPNPTELCKFCDFKGICEFRK
jgi:DNA helicase-2/ATP-dependent DNA helicase PcrA